MTPFLRTLFFFLVFCGHQLLISPLLLLFLVLTRGGRVPQYRHWTRPIATSWGRMICALGGVRLQVVDRSGIPADETVYYVSNHQGDFDIPVLLKCANRPLGFVAKKELASVPLVAQWMRIMGCIFLDRQNRRKQVEQIRQSVHYLRNGISMVVFPEGTRSRGSEMGAFAKGSLQIGLRANVRIVPVTLRDTYTLYPKDRTLIPGGSATVILHPAIDPEKLGADEKSGLMERVRGLIQSGLDESTPRDKPDPAESS